MNITLERKLRNKIRQIIISESHIDSNLISERFVNTIEPDDKLKYIDEVWDILEKSYAAIGGFKSASNKQHLIDKSWLWKMVRKNGKIIAVSIYKDKLGRKAIAMGSDGSNEGKGAVKQMFIDDMNLTDRNSWAEVSGAPEHILKKVGGIPIPNKLAAKILKKDIIELNPDGYHYTRLIAGEPHEKIIIGNIDKTKL